ncbi:unnamed protein product [Urochloa humidicola]
MARILASGAGAGSGVVASAALGSSWLFGLCMVVVSVWVVSLAVLLCGHSSSGDDRPKKKPAPAPATKKPAPAMKPKPKPTVSRGTARSGTVADSTGMYSAVYIGGAAAAACGCSAGHGGGGCGGGGGGGGCGGGGGGGC